MFEAFSLNKYESTKYLNKIKKKLKKRKLISYWNKDCYDEKMIYSLLNNFI